MQNGSISTGMRPRRYAPKRGSDGRRLGAHRQPFVGSRRGAPARRLVEDARAAVAARSAPCATGLHVQRDRSQCAGADPARRGHGRICPSGCCFSHRACLGPVRRAVPPEIALRSSLRRNGPRPLRTSRRRTAGVGVGHACQQRNRRHPAGRRRRRLVHEAGGLLHVDAVQALGKISFDIKNLKADLLRFRRIRSAAQKG